MLFLSSEEVSTWSIRLIRKTGIDKTHSLLSIINWKSIQHIFHKYLRDDPETENCQEWWQMTTKTTTKQFMLFYIEFFSVDPSVTTSLALVYSHWPSVSSIRRVFCSSVFSSSPEAGLASIRDSLSSRSRLLSSPFTFIWFHRHRKNLYSRDWSSPTGNKKSWRHSILPLFVSWGWEKKTKRDETRSQETDREKKG